MNQSYYHLDHEKSEDREHLSSIMIRLIDIGSREPIAKLSKVTASMVSRWASDGNGLFEALKMYFLYVYGKRHKKPNVRETLKDLANYLFNEVGIKATYIPCEIGTLKAYHETLR